MMYDTILKGIILLLIAGGFSGCSGKKSTGINNDTSDLLKVIFASNQIENHIVPSSIDSIFILKNRFYNQSFPLKSHRFIITYLDDSKLLRQHNPLNVQALDNRIRLNIPVFNITGDSAHIVLYNFNFGSSVDYKLKKRNNKWHIIKANEGME